MSIYKKELGTGKKEPLPEWFREASDRSDKWTEWLDKSHLSYFSLKPQAHNDNYDNYGNFIHEDLRPTKTFTFSFGCWENIGPLKNPVFASMEGVQEVLDATMDELFAIYINNIDRENWEDESSWDRYEVPSWKRIKADAKAFKNKFKGILAAQKAVYKKACDEYLDVQSSSLLIAQLVLSRNPLPPFFQPNYRFDRDSESKVLQVTFQFPDFKEEKIAIGFSANRKRDVKYASDTAKRKIVKETLYSIIIWVGHILARELKEVSVEQIAINVEQSWYDPATGKPVDGIIASVFGSVDYFASLNLFKVDPIACMRDLKGIVTPSLEKQSPIRPIFEMNKDDKRIVESKDVDGALVGGENLAMMPWEDFEHLVAQLFEWEFAKDGAEVKVTQASRDRGVDAILFDPDPIRGGKYVLQAKRYTLTVDVASVRDLYGTVMNEGANRGILITTSSYGPDSYEFAKDKPISLIDGPRLLEMLRKHGKDYKIDLKEARDLYGSEK